MSEDLSKSAHAQKPLAPGFSTDLHTVNIPRDFVSACAPLAPEAILLLIHFFSVVRARQDKQPVILSSELVESFAKWHGTQESSIKSALESLISQGLLLAWQEDNQTYLIPGTPAGRFLLQELKLNDRKLISDTQESASLEDERPNIFKLYETHIGMITPMMAEQLKQDEADFPEQWIEEALREAVHRNVRNWNYVRAILKAWKERGRDKAHEGHQSDIEAFRKLTREQQERNEP